MKNKKIKIDTFMKAIVIIAVAHGMILVSTSYVLSFFGYDPVVDLSVVIVKEIVAPIITYLAVNTIMNIFEKNCFTFCKPKDVYQSENRFDDLEG